MTFTEWLGLWRYIRFALLRVVRSNTKPNIVRKSANQNEDDKGNPAGDQRGIKIGVSYWMARVEKERCGYQSDRDRNQGPPSHAIGISARHRSNETELSHRWRGQAWPAMEMFS